MLNVSSIDAGIYDNDSQGIHPNMIFCLNVDGSAAHSPFSLLVSWLASVVQAKSNVFHVFFTNCFMM